MTESLKLLKNALHLLDARQQLRRSGHRRARLLVAGDKQLQLRGPAAVASCGPGLFTPAAAPRENVIIVINLRGCQHCQPSVATPVSAQDCAVKMRAVKMFLHLVLMGKCLHILLSTPLSIYLIEIWASGHYTGRHGQEDVHGEGAG